MWVDVDLKVGKLIHAIDYTTVKSSNIDQNEDLKKYEILHEKWTFMTTNPIMSNEVESVKREIVLIFHFCLLFFFSTKKKIKLCHKQTHRNISMPKLQYGLFIVLPSIKCNSSINCKRKLTKFIIPRCAMSRKNWSRFQMTLNYIFSTLSVFHTAKTSYT